MKVARVTGLPFRDIFSRSATFFYLKISHQKKGGGVDKKVIHSPCSWVNK